jgi:DNA-binding MarR family transcriptional regulator
MERDDFKKYATKHLGINSMVLDDVIKAQSQYLNPYILEERQLNVTQMDVFSRLMMDRIIFLGTPIDDYTANTLQAQLLYLDSGTLTPVLKKLEAKGYIVRKRSTVDERSLIISVTENGEALKDQAVEIPVEMGRCVHLDPEESKQLYHLLYKVIAAIEEPKTAE